MFRRYFFIFGLLLPLLMACQPTAGSPIAIPRVTSTVVPTPTLVAEEVTGNEAIVDSVEVMVTNALPARVFVTINGNFPDGCVSLSSAVPSRRGDVFSIDLTTVRDPLALCTEALVPFAEQVELDVEGLSSGTYNVKVLGMGTMASQIFFLPTLDMASEEMPMSELPAACFSEVAENGAFINLQDGYCLQYPVQEAKLHDIFAPIGVAAIWGIPLSPGLEPVRAGLTVYKQSPTNGRSLDDIVAEIITNNPGAEVVETTSFAGEPTQVVEGIDGMMDSRRHYLVHNDFVYEITLVPLTPIMGFEEAVTAQRDLMWQTVSESFTWLPETVVAQFSFCPTGLQESSPYVNPREEYCLLYPSYFQQQDMSVPNVTIFTGPATDPSIPEPVQVTLQVMTEAANGRSLEQIVNEVVTSAPQLGIEQSETTLGGETAVLVTGLPGRTAGRDLYAVHNDMLYHLRLDPLGFDQVSTDLTIVWERVLESFTFFP